jgi:hypothetical protein
MNIPTDRQIYHGELGTYWFEDDILISVAKSQRRTIDNIRSNAELVRQATGGKKTPVLVYLKPYPIPDRATRKCAAEHVPHLYSAMAMVSKPGLASFVMNITFALNPPTIPMRHFTDDWAAKEWLREYLEDDGLCLASELEQDSVREF